MIPENSWKHDTHNFQTLVCSPSIDRQERVMGKIQYKIDIIYYMFDRRKLGDSRKVIKNDNVHDANHF